jgi:hypothetical protein
MTTSTLQIPEAFSEVFGLGVPVAVYSVKKSSRWGMFVIMLLLCTGSGVALLWGAYNAYTRYLRYGPAIVVSSLTVPWIVAGVLFFVALMLAWSVFNNWKKAAVVYQNGLAYRDRKGMRAWRWDEFGSMTSAVTKHYTNGIYTGTTHTYTLTKRNGESFKLNDTITEVEKLANEIRQHIFPLLYDLYAQAYNQGQALIFGPVKLSKAEGIRIGKKVYAWNEIEQVAIQKGILSVKKKGGRWFSGANAAAASIPNLEVLLSIIDQVKGLKTG